MKLLEGISHLDHGLTQAQLDHVMHRFWHMETFFIESIELPEELGTVKCLLFGPAMGDPPVEESEVLYRIRLHRKCASRVVERDPRPARTITVIGGPYTEKCKACNGRGELDRLVHDVGRDSGTYTCPKCGGARDIKHACVLYTVYGGPMTPREPGDTTIPVGEVEEARVFWAQHALARGTVP